MTYRLSDPLPITMAPSVPTDGGCDNPACTCHGESCADFTTLPSALFKLEREIAIDWARTLVECRSLWMPSKAPNWVYDVSQLDPDKCLVPELIDADMDDLTRAVRYLDMLGMLVRPGGAPHLVAFSVGA